VSKKMRFKMAKAKKVVDAKADSKGNITAVRIEGNKSFTAIETAIKIAERGQLSNVTAVHPKNKSAYLRSTPDSKKSNNLDEMAKKK
jgi:Protein of unknown function (DUF3892)